MRTYRFRQNVDKLPKRIYSLSNHCEKHAGVLSNFSRLRLMAWWLLVLVVLLSSPFQSDASAATGQSAATREIEHLFEYLERSGCEFFRNGDWYGAEKAADHLRRKYEYYLNYAVSPSADEFIAEAASKSSMSGQSYQVRCPGQGEQASGNWFSAELERYRLRAE